MLKVIFIFLCTLLCTGVHAEPLQNQHLLADERNTIELFQKYAPNVVYVHRLTTYINYDDEPFDVPAGAGSGIMWDQQGHIVTNFHVIQGADKLAVSVGHVTVAATVVGVEPHRDIAVLKVSSPHALTFLQHRTPFVLAPTNELLVGQKTIAIGNPFGLDHSLTVGVISALGRQVPGIGGVTIRNMIQTDASINPGNSGGPLLDSQGRLIGLNTAIFSSSGSSAGVGFAVPADDIGRIVPQLIRTGHITLAGIGITRIPPNTALQLGVRKGVLIGKILPRTPAAEAGLQGTYRTQWGHIHVGDLIVGINGHPVANYDDLYNQLIEVPVGQMVTITILRDKKELSLRMKTIDITSY